MTETAALAVCRDCPDQYSRELLTEGRRFACCGRRDPRTAEVQGWIRMALAADNGDVLGGFIDRLQAATSAAAKDLGELKKHSNKAKGDYFEILAALYLAQAKGWVIWRLPDAPDWALEECKLERNDLGVDLVAWSEEGWVAVQAKYRKPTDKKEWSTVGWADLATFYSRTDRSGPWYQRIVITTAKGIRRVGKLSPGDHTIAYGTLKSIDRTVWLRMAGSTGQALGGMPKGEAPPRPAPKPKPVGHVLSTGEERKTPRPKAAAKPKAKKAEVPKKAAPVVGVGQVLAAEAVRPAGLEELRAARLARLGLS